MTDYHFKWWMWDVRTLKLLIDRVLGLNFLWVMNVDNPLDMLADIFLSTLMLL